MKSTISILTASVAAAFIFMTAGCGGPATAIQFSKVLDGGFDPVAVFQEQGYTVLNEKRGETLKNPPLGYGWQSWCGVLTKSEEGPLDCGEIAVALRAALDKTLGTSTLDELTRQTASAAGQPMTGMVRYNKDAVHGDVHVWLVPDATNSSVSYVIFVSEERIRN